MGRKRTVLIIAAAILLTAAVFTYISLSHNDIAADKNQVSQEPATAARETEIEAGGTTAGTVEATQSETTSAGPEIVKSEDVEITGNSPEYDLKALLCEYSDKSTLIRLEYYLDGAGTALDVDSSRIPELSGIFEKRDEAGAASGSYKVRAAYLNPVYSKLYVQIAGKSFERYEETVFYSIDLKNSTTRKLFNYTGKYSKMAFNKSYSMLAYSFGDPPELSVFQENTLFEILDCKTDEFKVKGSRTASLKIVGGRDTTFFYDYDFIAWKSDTVVRLKQTVFSKKSTDGKPVAEGEVLYDIAKDKFMNTDGSPLAVTAETAAKDPAAAVKGGEEAAKVLKDFYSYLPSDSNYKKAMDLLDDNFKLQLELMAQFGATEIIKSDIDAEGVSMFSDILKAAKLDSIVKVELSEGTYDIYYYQSLSLNADSQVRQALMARIGKVKGAFKILLIRDADGEKPPFVQ